VIAERSIFEDSEYKKCKNKGAKEVYRSVSSYAEVVPLPNLLRVIN